jgi:para-aminobenzoate synthetase
MRTLLIDNYDSFTYNLYHLWAEVCGSAPLVLQNDDWTGWADLDKSCLDAIIISPGPGRPERERDFGISRLALACVKTPVLGVCLGHQGLCQREGARIERAPEPFHGRTSRILHTGHALFDGIPSPFLAVRYHSLVARDIPNSLDVIANTEDGLVMAVAHRDRPHFGVQFHPESIATEYGRELLGNFRRAAGPGRGAVSSTHIGLGARARDVPGPTSAGYGITVRRLDDAPEPQQALSALFGNSEPLAWLDSNQEDSRAGYSMLCNAGPELGEVVRYWVDERRVVVERPAGGDTSHHPGTLFDYLERELALRRVPPGAAPVDFALGYVGVLGYELKGDLGSPNRHSSQLPDALLLFCDRGYVYDHRTGTGWLMALYRGGSEGAARDWIARASERLFRATTAGVSSASSQSEASVPLDAARRAVVPRYDAVSYRALVTECQRAIAEGESYELCLTNCFTIPFDGDALGAYFRLRRQNPAPYAAFLRLPGVSVLSSSPECFLRGESDGRVQSRPIKGTAPRSSIPEVDAQLRQDLLHSEKERAENLMIVDLVRNDLGRVCQISSVHVPSLYAVESYATVHQLVSTVCGQLSPGVSAIDCVRACFPGGSMTGAPKLRAMEILGGLEGGARGFYSGALGYFSLNGAFDLSIVIRTLVLVGDQALLGSGGAVVAQSEPDREVAEAELKAAAVLGVFATPA